MNNIKKIIGKSYIYLILIITYIPLIFAFIFSFNKPNHRGFLSFHWNGGTTESWTTFFSESRDVALINSVLIAILVTILTLTISLLTVYALWKQKNKNYEKVTKTLYSSTLINPDIITAMGLVLIYGLLFGTLSLSREGILRTVIGHTVITLPYSISIMLPASDKFNKSLFEACQDLGYSKLSSWFRVYVRHMLPTLIFSAVISIFFSFDDFIITRLVSNTSTLGTKLYESRFRGWGLVVGGALMIATLIGSLIYVIYKNKGNLWKKKIK
ncbi:ABC transporter permease [Mycoplasma sp. Mirounga ES2805-ORL]|uniref:ABC transporter permease n=1 Tax=Mycoplasma sp. Mirounga ES2805-ORL TaxID=754514 RepID=UPI00197C3801|nr:ABC transporter permease subunit [Mycoplasma sp. Mirounga ES2805-ORL]QSF13975.1 ABC transporter permease subunit [Mycoplasma sp. Mirounga ES2805-ORL]